MAFVMEFHLPYMVVRDKLREDPRRLRRSHEMLSSLEMETRGVKNESFYSQAQVSLLIFGVDEWLWTAYCCVDVFFGSDETPEGYLDQFDGPSGGARVEYLPAWNPREYFLSVCARRLKQATKEWDNVILQLESRLDEYVAARSTPLRVFQLANLIAGARIRA
jgi:hypothetical protein